MDGQDRWEIALYGQDGQKILDRAGKGPATAIDISGLNAGVYFISVRSGQKTMNRKFIKQ